jgi:5'-3' exonuclease
MDLSQLLAEDVIIYNMTDKDFVTVKNFSQKYGYFYKNVVVKKIFCGDVSDNISNITGLSEEGFFKLMPEAKTRQVTVSEVKQRAADLIEERKNEKKKPLKLHENIVKGVGNKKYEGDFYTTNTKLIDLSHPLMSKEAKETLDSMMYAPVDPSGRSFANLYKYILEDKIEELDSDARFTSFFTLFKRLEEKEKKRFEESQK